jgi:hypothetical protein
MQQSGAGFWATRRRSCGRSLDCFWEEAAMMRLCCLSLNFQREFASRQMDDLKFINLCGQLGLDGVDFNLRSFQSLEREHLNKIKKTCLERGLSIACLGVSNDFGRPADERGAVQQRVRQGIDTAQFLGASLVRPFAGSLKFRETREVVWMRAVDGLRQSAVYGEKVGEKKGTFIVLRLQACPSPCPFVGNQFTAREDNIAVLVYGAGFLVCRRRGGGRR